MEARKSLHEVNINPSFFSEFMNIHHEKVIGVRLARKSVKNMTPFFHYQITMLKHFHEICFKKRKKQCSIIILPLQDVY